MTKEKTKKGREYFTTSPLSDDELREIRLEQLRKEQAEFIQRNGLNKKKYYQQGNDMAGKATSVYVTVTTNNSRTTVLHRKFLNSTDANAYMKENAEKYPKPEFQMFKETYQCYLPNQLLKINVGWLRTKAGRWPQSLLTAKVSQQ